MLVNNMELGSDGNVVMKVNNNGDDGGGVDGFLARNGVKKDHEREFGTRC